MTCNPPATPLSPRNGFLIHKYLLVAIVESLQAQHPARPAPSPAQRSDTAVHRWMREPSAERERTPCVVMREHHVSGDLTVVRVALERVSPGAQPLAEWIRQRIPAAGEPDQDTLHLAMAPTLPGMPIIVHSIAGTGEHFTHLFFDGVWTVCKDDRFLLRAIRYAHLVGTVIPLTGRWETAPSHRAPAPVAAVPDEDQPCDLTTLGRIYDHIGVHAAIAELREFRRIQGRACAAPSDVAASGR